MRFTFGIQLLLAAIIAVGPLSTDVYLPAFPAIEAEFGSGPGSAQTTLAAWFIGLGIGQLMHGVLSDRFGRRAPLVVANLLYAAASAGCALAPDMASLSAFRVLAAMAGAAGMVIPRAMVRDVSEGNEAARILSRMMLIMGVAPIVAPTLGGLVTEFWSWRLIFWLSTVYGLVCAVLVFALLPDTLPRERRRAIALASFLARVGLVLRDRVFLLHAATTGAMFFCLFAYLSGAPSAFAASFGMRPGVFGMVSGAVAASFIIGSQLNARLIGSVGVHRMLHIAARMLLPGVLLVAVAVWMGAGLWLLIPPLCSTAFCHGMASPNATAGALTRHAANAGIASALFGLIQFGMGGLAALATGLLADGTLTPIVGLMFLGAIGAWLADWFRPKAF